MKYFVKINSEITMKSLQKLLFANGYSWNCPYKNKQYDWLTSKSLAFDTKQHTIDTYLHGYVGTNVISVEDAIKLIELPKTIIVYKICYLKDINPPFTGDNILTSYASDIRDSHWCVQYKIGEISQPIGKSMLFAYDTLENAKQYLLNNYLNSNDLKKFVIVKCETSNIRKLTLDYAPSCEYAQTFWRKYNNKKKYSKLSGRFKLPRGTILCSYLKPLEIVYNSQ